MMALASSPNKKSWIFFWFFFGPLQKLVSLCMLELKGNRVLKSQTLQAVWEGPFPAKI